MSNNGINAGIISQLFGSSVPLRVTDSERDLLRRLLAAEDDNDGEQLTRFVPGGWMLGSESVSAKTCFRLIRHCFIKQDGEESGGVSYWAPCVEEAQHAVTDPDYEPIILRYLKERGGR